MPEDLDALRARLVERLEAVRQASEASAESRKPVELDQTTVGRLSRMDALQVQAMAKATERQRLSEIQRIQGAIERIDEGEYGACVMCGDDIAEKRLAVDPTIPTCIACASRAGA